MSDEVNEEKPKAYPQWAVKTDEDGAQREFVVRWHVPVYFGTDSDGDYVFHTDSQDPGDGEYVPLNDLCEDWDWSSYISQSDLVSVRKVPFGYDPKNDDDIR